MFIFMRHRITQISAQAIAALVLAVAASSASAACIAEYKAKQDNPLRLEHDRVEINGPCTIEAATTELQALLNARGWTLLKVLSVSQT